MASNTSANAVYYLNLSETTTSNDSSTNGATSTVLNLQVTVLDDRQYSLNRYLTQEDQLAPDHPEYRLRAPVAFKPQLSSRDSRRQNKRRMAAILRAIEAKLDSSG